MTDADGQAAPGGDRNGAHGGARDSAHGARGGAHGSGQYGAHSEGPLPRLLCDTEALAALSPAPAGALWKLSEPGRQLDANVVHLEPGRHVGAHAEPDLDVLLLVVAGSGTLETGRGGQQQLTPGQLYWLPHGSSRSLVAGDEGLRYLTVHRRRPGLRIRGRE